jgi:Flp pilus assembly pilin Flp
VEPQKEARPARLFNAGLRHKELSMKLIRAFWTNDSGQGLTEYAAIIALVSIGLMLVLIAFRNELGRIYNLITSELRSQTSSINQYPVSP